MSSNVAIQVENLSKCYQIYAKPHDRLKQSIYPRVQNIVGRPSKQYFQEFWALKNISFEVKRGETVGIVGRNGSGKSTLLQLICGTLNPTLGVIKTNGRIAALLELGSGFNPEFTGYENVYLNAALLGLSKEEIDNHYDDIVAFADIGDFLHQPVKTYSSGMMLRLAFAVQAQVSPDILIVDEALAVGDAKFQAKCFDQLKRLKENGTSILLVTHSSEQIVTHCSSALLLENGIALEAGKPRFVVNRYLDLLFGKQKDNKSSPESITVEGVRDDKLHRTLNYTNDAFASRPGYNEHEYRWGTGKAKILDFSLDANGESYPSTITSGQNIILAVTVHFYETLIRPILGLTVKTKEGVTVYGANSETLDIDEIKSFGQRGQGVIVKAAFCCRLGPGDYFISLGIATKEGETVTPHDRRYDSIHLVVRPVDTFFGLADLDLTLNATDVSCL